MQVIKTSKAILELILSGFIGLIDIAEILVIIIISNRMRAEIIKAGAGLSKGSASLST